MEKYCENCGTKNAEGSKFCTGCGKALTLSSVQPTMVVNNFAPTRAQATPRNSNGKTLLLVAAILNWIFYAIIAISTAGVGLLIGAWLIPMTIFTHKACNDNRKHVALGVCTLLFINLISGILILCAGGEDE